MDSVMRNHQEERTFAGMFLHEINGSLRQIDIGFGLSSGIGIFF